MRGVHSSARWILPVAAAAAVLLATACGGGEIIEEDAGVEPDDDAGREEQEDLGFTGPNPFVEFSVPTDGAEGRRTDTNVLLVFSQEMDPTVGTVELQPADVVLDASRGTWLNSEDIPGLGGTAPNRAVVVSPPAELQGGVEQTVTVSNDFRSATGRNLVETQNGEENPFIFRFTTLDVQPPRVVECNPPEQGLNLSAASIPSITCTFDEQMNIAIGGLRLIPSHPLRDAVWSDAGRTVTWELVRPLAYDTTYQGVLEDFLDRSENLLDQSTYLGNGVLDFSTGPDADQPFVVVSVPTEGQRGVNPALTEIFLELSEPMDTELRRSFARLDNLTASTSVDLEGTFNGDGTVLTFAVPTGALLFMSDYSLDLSPGEYRDVNGNLLDTETYLVDGSLTFRVDTDTFGPRVLSSTPEEGEVDVAVDLPTISVRFDEPMDTSLASAVLSSTDQIVTVDGTWSAADTIIDFDVRGAGVRAGREYRLELRPFRDATGNELDAADLYLGDGVVDFRTADPNGDNCTQPLTELQATATASGGLQWRIGSGALTDDGSTDTCDGDAAGGAGDLVIEYEKTSGTLAEGGELLSVLVASDTTSLLNFELRADSCVPDPEVAPLACHESMRSGGTTFDVPAGTYYLWVAKESGGDFPGATVTIEELPAWPEGESCNAPYTTGSPSVYVPPRTPGGPHTFQIRTGVVQTVDRTPISNGPGEISCAFQHGQDAVVEFTKMPGSVLSVRAIPVDIRSSAADLNLEISLGCEPSFASYQALDCAPGFDTVASAEVTGPGGPIYFWLSSSRFDRPFPGATLEITEISVGAGESCGTARTLTGPVAEIEDTDLESARRLGSASCIDPLDDIAWFSYTATEDVVLVEGDADGPMILADQETTQTITCTDDASRATPALIRAGRTVCIGLPTSTDVRELTFSELEYGGVRGQIIDHEIARPIGDDGNPVTWREDRWLATTDSLVYFGFRDQRFQERIMFAPIAGMAGGVIPDGIGSAQLGWTAVTVDDDLFTWSETTSSTNQRVWLANDGVTFPWRPEGWDETPRNYNDFSDTIQATCDGANLLYASNDFTDFAIYELPVDRSAAPVQVARFNDIEDVTGFAADGTYIYFHANYFPSGGPSINEGLWRLPRTSFGLANAVPERLAAYDTDCCRPGPLALDRVPNPTTLYARQVVSSAPNQVHVVVEPDSAEPLYLGPVVRLGRTVDRAMSYQAGALWMYESETTTDGRLVCVE